MEKKKRSEFAELLVRLIKAKKMTQSKYYATVGITKPYFYDILSQKVTPSPEVQFRMIEALKPIITAKEKEHLFDLMANDEIPVDIAQYLKGDAKKYALIRAMMNEE